MSRIKVTLIKRGNIYYLRYFYAGKDTKVSTKTVDQDKATNIRDQFEAKINSESFDDYNGRILFSDLSQDYLEYYAKPHFKDRTWKDYLS